MANKEHIKIIVSAIIVIVLISMGIYAFIFRNELSQKIQEIGKKNDDPQAKVDRIILPPSSKDVSDGKKEDPTGKDRPPEQMQTEKIKNTKKLDDKMFDPTLNQKTDRSFDENLVSETETKKPSEKMTSSEEKKSIGKKKKFKKRNTKSIGRKKTISKNLERRVARLEKKLGVRSKRQKYSLEKRIQCLEKISAKKNRHKKSKAKRKSLQRNS